MKKIILIFILFFSLNLYAQQDPLLSHYFFMKETFNPAYAGFDGEEVCANLLSHQQWKKFENAPFTTFLSVDAPVSLFNENWGVGINFIDDRYGFVRDFRGNLTLAYNREIGPGKISFGINPGIFSKKFDPTWKFPDQSESILPQGVNATIFDIGAGVYYQLNKIFVGVSSFHFLRPSFNFESDGATSSSSIFLVNHFYFIGGYNFTTANSVLEITPSVFVKSDGNDLQYDINIFALYNKKIWASVTYRNKSALAFFVGTSYFNNIKLGLSYDVALNYINRVSAGTLEAYVGYCFAFMKVKNAQKYRNVKTL